MQAYRDSGPQVKGTSASCGLGLALVRATPERHLLLTDLAHMAQECSPDRKESAEDRLGLLRAIDRFATESSAKEEERG